MESTENEVIHKDPTTVSDTFITKWRQNIIIFGGLTVTSGANMMLAIEHLDEGWKAAGFTIATILNGIVAYNKGKDIMKELVTLRKDLEKADIKTEEQ